VLNSTVLEVAVGLVLVYFLFSTLCSAIQEGLAAWMGLRAKELEKAIVQLLGPEYQQELYDHPLISGMMRPVIPPPRTTTPATGAPAAPAAGSTTTAATTAAPAAAVAPPAPASACSLTPQRARPQYIEPKTFSRALIDVLTGDQPPTFVALSQVVQDNPTGVKQAVGALMGGMTAVVGEGITRDVLADAEKLREAKLNIENWYNDAMERLSGRYKRYSQVIILAIAIVVCGIGNVDSLAICDNLAHNATLRASVVAVAQREAQKSNQALTPARDMTQIATDVKGLEQLGFPLGWRWSGPWSQEPGVWVKKIVGLLMSVVALTLGAPFWFDVLNRLVNVRTSGNRPDTDQKNHVPTFVSSR
jgi:hypothetical protein